MAEERGQASLERRPRASSNVIPAVHPEVAGDCSLAPLAPGSFPTRSSRGEREGAAAVDRHNRSRPAQTVVRGFADCELVRGSLTPAHSIDVSNDQNQEDQLHNSREWLG